MRMESGEVDRKGAQFRESLIPEAKAEAAETIVESFDDDNTKRIDSPQANKKDDSQLNLSFSGCGFLGIYHVGVATSFSQYAPQVSTQKISGSSAGALVAVAHICGNLQLAYAVTDFLTVAIAARSRALGPFHPSFDINALIGEALERGLPEDIHIKATGRLHVSLTRVHDGQNVIISEFNSKQDVIQVILCSCFVPFWTGFVLPKYRGVSYIDGGFSNNLLTLDDKTITVAPFAGEADICPGDSASSLLQVSFSNTSISVSPHNLYRLSHALLPSPPEILSELCEQGFADGIRYLQRMNLISCTKCVEIRSSLIVSTDGEDIEEAFTNEVTFTTDEHPPDNHHYIRVEQQEQKMIEIRGRRDSVVSTTSQTCPEDMIYEEQPGFLESCDQCVAMRQKALEDALPRHVAERISEACDNVNKSLSNWIYSHRPIKYLSYMAAPYYLPVDLSLSLIYQCWRRLPDVRNELYGCVNHVVNFLIGILNKMDAEESTSALLLNSATNWEADAHEYEKEIMKHQIKNTKKSSINSISNNSTTNSLSNSTGKSCCNAKNPGDYAVKITSDGVCVCKLSGSASRSASSNQLHSLEDTFDSIVDETSNQESRIFAYYFRDAKNRLQVTEIFDRQRTPDFHSSHQSLNIPSNHTGNSNQSSRKLHTVSSATKISSLEG